MGTGATFAVIVGGFIAFFLVFALVITPFGICPSTLQYPETSMGDPIEQLCHYVTNK
jgi:ATP/ADP translocase